MMWKFKIIMKIQCKRTFFGKYTIAKMRLGIESRSRMDS